MKKVYCKPQIVVEDMLLDDPIATSGCSMNFRTDPDVALLKELNCFVDSTCEYLVQADGGFDFNGDGEVDQGFHDTVCYHSNINKLFYS